MLFLLVVKKRPDGLSQFCPVLQESVVPAGRLYLLVAHLRPGFSRLPRRLAHLHCREEPVAGDADEEHLGLYALARLLLRGAPGPHVVEVHRAGEVEVGVRVEAAGQVATLVVEIALDLEPPAELFVERRTARGPPAEPLPLSFGALVGNHT